jgi:hypothetical protein
MTVTNIGFVPPTAIKVLFLFILSFPF